MHYPKEYVDVSEFVTKLGYALPAKPALFNKEEMLERVRQLREEVDEIEVAVQRDDLVELADGLVDLTYFVYCFAAFCGLPWAQVWTVVHEANMTKHAGSTARARRDAIKPEDFKQPEPQIREILRGRGAVV